MMTTTTSLLDPVLVEVMRHELLAVSEEMNITMRRTTRSIAAKETNDFSSAILDRDGRPILQAVPYGLRVFAQGMPFVIEKLAGTFRPGDVIVTNDPYQGASHLPDIMVAMPIFWRDELVGFAATFQHHTDIGGRFPGGFGSVSRQLYEEGLRLPIVHFYRGGQPEQSVHDIIAANVRAPDDVLGDLEANAAACRRGAAGMLELFEKHGLDIVTACCEYFIAATERHVRALFASIPDGRYAATGVFDDGAGTTIDLSVALLIEGSSLTIDLSGCQAQLDAAWNIPPGMPFDVIVGPLLGLVPDPEMVVNAGLLDALKLVAPEGTVVNPLFPAAVASRAQPLSVLADLILDAFSSALLERVPAPGEGGLTVLVYSADKPEGKAPGVLTDIWAGGWGARSDADGIDGVVMISANGFRASSGEMMEIETALALEGFGFVTDSGGPGTYRGTTSVFRRFRVKQPGRVMLRTCRSNAVALGRAGGGSGGPFSARLIRNGVESELPRQSVLDFSVLAGDVVEHVVSGGAGFGDPFVREPSRVLEDVRDAKVSVAGAGRDYGVVINPSSLEIDEDATRVLRAARPVSR
jgi:N-methylhydantoinase B